MKGIRLCIVSTCNFRKLSKEQTHTDLPLFLSHTQIESHFMQHCQLTILFQPIYVLSTNKCIHQMSFDCIVLNAYLYFGENGSMELMARPALDLCGVPGTKGHLLSQVLNRLWPSRATQSAPIVTQALINGLR